MRYKFIFFLKLVLLSKSVLSQTINFGNFSNKDWDIQDCMFDTTANAFILFDIGDLTIRPKNDIRNTQISCPLKIEHFEISFTRNLRIKIIDTLELQYDKLNFTLRKQGDLSDKLLYFKGIISWQENDEVQRIKIDNKDLGKQKDDNGNTIYTCTFPKIKMGCIIDIEYTIISTIFNLLPEWSYTNTIPSIHSEYNVAIPDFLVYESEMQLIRPQILEKNFEKGRCSVWYLGTDGNYTIKDYEYSIYKKSYSLSNIKSSSKSDIINPLRLVLTKNNINAVYGKPTGMRMYH